MEIEIDIAVTPAVKQFIASKFSIEPFVVTTTNSYGTYLHNCLVKLKCHPATTYKRLKPEIYSERLRLIITEDMYRRYGWFIHPKKQYFFNRFVEQLMQEHFAFYMGIYTLDLGMRQHDSYMNFREHFGLNEDNMPLKTMEKRWERINKRLIA